MVGNPNTSKGALWGLGIGALFFASAGLAGVALAGATAASAAAGGSSGEYVFGDGAAPAAPAMPGAAPAV